MWTPTRTIWRSSLTALLLGLGLAQPEGAGALDIAVVPVRIHLSPDKRSAMLTVSNPNAEPITVQASVFAWRQSLESGDALDPSQDLLVFPQIFAIQPGASRNIRVGTTQASRGTERAFRILLEPIPTPTTPSNEAPGLSTASMTVITRASIPVFLQPSKPVPAPLSVALRVTQGRLLVDMTNPGTVYTPPQGLTIKGYAGDDLVLEGETRGWYVLAGSSRTQTINLPKEKCPALSRLVVEVHSGGSTNEYAVPVSPDRCSDP
jgi:fimbrial chaperone protein